jgi:hypothetical protein
VPLAGQLHCSYVVSSELADAGRDHLTWAHGELFARPVSPVSRRELHQGGLCLLGLVLPPGAGRKMTGAGRPRVLRSDACRAMSQ